MNAAYKQQVYMNKGPDVGETCTARDSKCAGLAGENVGE